MTESLHKGAEETQRGVAESYTKERKTDTKRGMAESYVKKWKTDTKRGVAESYVKKWKIDTKRGVAESYTKELRRDTKRSVAETGSLHIGSEDTDHGRWVWLHHYTKAQKTQTMGEGCGCITTQRLRRHRPWERGVAVAARE